MHRGPRMSMSSHFTLNREPPQESTVHVNPDIEQILQFLSVTKLNLTCLQQDIDRIHANLQQIRSLVVASMMATEDAVFMDADTFNDRQAPTEPHHPTLDSQQRQPSHRQVIKEACQWARAWAATLPHHDQWNRS
jgi:hypothetical protein